NKKARTGHAKNLMAQSKNSVASWKLVFLSLVILFLEFAVVWEAKIILAQQSLIETQRGGLVATSSPITEECEAAHQLQDLLSKRLSFLLNRENELFANTIGCGSIWEEYRATDGEYFFWIPEELVVEEEESDCGLVDVRVYHPKDETFNFLISFGEQLETAQLGEEALVPNEVIASLDQPTFSLLDKRYQPQTTEYLAQAWAESFNLEGSFFVPTFDCYGQVRAEYETYSQRLVVSRILASFRFLRE
ncbi:hypothetical protein MUP65_01745, partial [Patescibacteria group bacterium]|nr:hypothetical protein [Patescibacteria group bacterium]